VPLQLLNVISWFIANVYVVAAPCRWFDGFVIVNGALGSRQAAMRLRLCCDTPVPSAGPNADLCTSVSGEFLIHLIHMRTGFIQWSCW
jgi:hypothetical protein